MVRIFVSLLLSLVLGCGESDSNPARVELADSAATNEISTPIRFAGSSACIRCHPAEGAKWRGSDHDRAMEEATSESVEGRFDNSTLRHVDQTWRFMRDDEDFVVELEVPGRSIERLKVVYTFGFDPLQQYLVARPNGRLQALPIAWDARSQDEGGQRWIDLQPEGSIEPDDPIHWDGLAYNWNSQCASCHSTQLDKGYDEKTRSFETRWAEIDVACEACHGPGSIHVERMAESRSGRSSTGRLSSGLPVSFEPWSEHDWRRAPGNRIASRVAERGHDVQLDVCGPCHSRRSPITELPVIGGAFLDHYRPRLLDAEVYFEDGQIRDEVYVWGSFLQSRMYAAGVRCADCHDPHSLELRRSGGDLCLGCHARDVFATKQHHGHDVTSQGAECVACHMPERVYMEVDGRRDHSFSIPRPERSASLGSPSVCRDCHADRDAIWAKQQIDSWRDEGASSRPHWADHLIRDSSARSDGDRFLEIALDSSLPSIVRASAWSRAALESNAIPPLEALQARLREGSELERMALVDLAALLPAALRASLLRPLLEDEFRAVRIASAMALADLPASLWRPVDRSLLGRALAEYRSAQTANEERPEAQVNLGILSIRSGEPEAARAAYRKAIDRAPYFLPAYANLADLERSLGRDAEAVILLREALRREPEAALIRHALGLALHRMGQSDEALEELGRAAEGAPDQPRVVLAWALALDAAGRRPEAIVELRRAVDVGGANPDLHHALVTLLRDEGREGDESHRIEALERAQKWRATWPDDRRARALVEELGGQNRDRPSES